MLGLVSSARNKRCGRGRLVTSALTPAPRTKNMLNFYARKGVFPYSNLPRTEPTAYSPRLTQLRLPPKQKKDEAVKWRIGRGHMCFGTAWEIRTPANDPDSPQLSAIISDRAMSRHDDMHNAAIFASASNMDYKQYMYILWSWERFHFYSN